MADIILRKLHFSVSSNANRVLWIILVQRQKYLRSLKTCGKQTIRLKDFEKKVKKSKKASSDVQLHPEIINAV
jgi:hypothetical protein